MTLVESAVVLALTAGMVLGSLRVFQLLAPWQQADFEDVVDISSVAPPILGSAVLQGGEGRRDGRHQPVVLTSKDAEGHVVRADLSRMAAYVLMRRLPESRETNR